MRRSISQVRLLSIIRVGIAAQAHIPCHELSPGKRIRTTWIDENRDTDELYRMYLGESPVMELREDGSHRVYVYGDGRLLATADYAGPDGEPEIHYYLMDHLGSTIAVLDETGVTVWPSSNPDGYQTYQPYGEFVSDPGNAGFTIPSFTGKFADPGTGNHYFNARYHTSDTGTTKGPMQFSSPDPVYGNLSDPLSWNRYAYCRNNPVMYTDPDGRAPVVKDENIGNSEWKTLKKEWAQLTLFKSSDFQVNAAGKVYVETKRLLEMRSILDDKAGKDDRVIPTMHLYNMLLSHDEYIIHDAAKPGPSGVNGTIRNRDNVAFGWFDILSSNQADIWIDFQDFTENTTSWKDIDYLTWCPGMSFFHEAGAHIYKRKIDQALDPSMEAYIWVNENFRIPNGLNPRIGYDAIRFTHKRYGEFRAIVFANGTSKGALRFKAKDVGRGAP